MNSLSNDTHFDYYLQQIKKYNIHPQLIKLYNQFPTSLYELSNIIFYGPSASGKYSQALQFMSKYSPSALKYEKKVIIAFDKKTFHFKISDIHFEVDMGLLGCNSKLLWHEIYHKIIDIISANPHKYNCGIILCKNFHLISNELLDCFYSYIQQNILSKIKIHFILITDEFSFIPNNITHTCALITVPRPSKIAYTHCTTHKKLNIDSKHVSNIKSLQSPNYTEVSVVIPHKKICDEIIELLLNKDEMPYSTLRTVIYNIFIFNLNIHECMWYIISVLIDGHKIKDKYIFEILQQVSSFFKYFNNNYRPIYHVEYILLFIYNKIHEY
jgi:hypothetical protein